MSVNRSRAGLGLALLTSVWVGVSACSSPRGGDPTSASALDFNHITEAQLKSSMGRLAVGVKRLQAIFADRKPITPDQRLEVIAVLDQMIIAADELGPDGVSSNHSRITHNLPRFREKLEIARESASMQPPRYYLVGNLSGTCLACHAK